MIGDERTAVSDMVARAWKSPFHAALLLSLSVFLWLSCHTASAGTVLREADVLEVNDGDTVTLEFDNRVYRTRLIGIDAPEMGQRPWGRKAKDHLTAIMRHSDWTVSVETDVVTHDKYDRLLGYLWTKQNELINEQMILDGYAVLFTIQPNSKYADRFRRAQQAAREKKAGIWGPKGLKERPLDYKKAHPRNERR